MINDHDGEVLHGVFREVEVFGYLGLFLESDIRSVISEAFVQCPLCRTSILHSTVLTFNQIDYTLCLTGVGGRCKYPIGFVGDLVSESVSFLDEITGLTASSFTSLVSCVFCEGDRRLSY